MIAAAASPALSIRPARADDQAFVAATLVEQLSRGGMRRQANSIADRVFDSTLTRVLVATEGGRIIGWLAYAAIPRVRCVLFAYVRKQHRGQGVARELVDTAWPERTGAWVTTGLSGGDTAGLTERFKPTSVGLEEVL